jgi:hypothetical protein
MDIPKDLFTARLGDELMVCLDLDVATADNVVTSRSVLAYFVSFTNEKLSEAQLTVKGPTDVLHQVKVHFW